MDPASIIITVLVSIIISAIIFNLSKKEKDLVYDWETKDILFGKLKINEKLKVHYDEKEVESLSITKISLCNKGLETINSTDVTDTDPITIEFEEKDLVLLDYSLIYESRKVNKILISKLDQQNKFKINFEFLDKNDGAIFQFVHTHLNLQNVKVNGTIKGNKGRIIRRYYSSGFIDSFSKFMLRYGPGEGFLSTIILIVLLPILIVVVNIGFILDTIFNYERKMPRIFILNSMEH